MKRGFEQVHAMRLLQSTQNVSLQPAISKPCVAGAIRDYLRPIRNSRCHCDQVGAWKDADSGAIDRLWNRASVRVCRGNYSEVLVSLSVDPEIRQSPSFAFHIGWPLTERMHVWIRFEKYPSVLRVTRKQSQSPSKFWAANFDTPLPRPSFDLYSSRIAKRHEA
jgi:hypothetical protein